MNEGQSSGRPTQGTVYYRARDAQGRVYFADSREQLPAGLREKAEEIVVEKPASAVTHTWPTPTRSPGWPIVALGVGAAVVVAALLLMTTRRGLGVLMKVAVFGAVVVLGVGAYFGWLRHATGQGGAIVGNPAELVDEARRAVEQVKQRRQEEQRALEQIDKERR